MSGINITVSPGEFIDRLVILRLKQEHARAPNLQGALASQVAEFEALRNQMHDKPGLTDLETALSLINRKLWQAEDDLRLVGSDATRGQAFSDVARLIADMNDERARLKAGIDGLFGWQTTEAKLYSFE